jgi:FkbH-like protein
MTRESPAGEGTVKCVVWDIDNTLLTGIYLEAGDQPPGADPVLTTVLAELGERGILHALASKNPPEAAAHTARVTGWRFAAAECGWGRKSDALARIAATLGIGVDALAFVDDDPFERAEVGFALPGVLVLSPEDAAEAPGWPEFSPPVITPEARRRAEMYAERQRRQAAERSFGGTKEEFLETVGTRVNIAAATAADVPRLHELAARTRQFNSVAGQPPATGAGPAAGMTQDWFRGLLAAGDCDVATVRLRDAFGDDGLVGACVVMREAGIWTVPLLMMSCRAMGRGVIDALLAWLVRQAARAGARRLRIPCVANTRNVPLRLALAAAGFRVPEAAGTAGQGTAGQGTAGQGTAGRGPEGGEAGGGNATSGQVPAVFERDVGTALPVLPGWVEAPGEQGGDAA